MLYSINTMQPNTSSPMRTFLRVLVVGGIIILLVFLSIGIVKIVPKVVSSLASATVSITSIFDGNGTTTPNQNTGGFEISNNNVPPAATTTTSTVKTGTSNTVVKNPTTYTNNYSNGTPDLAVNIISRGVINSANGAYVETLNFTSSDTVVVKFKVENRGTAPTGNFNLSVAMPAGSSADRLRQITNVGSIPAGAAIEAQAVFTNPQVGTNLPITISADPSGLTRDSNRGNNVSSIGINVIQGSNYPTYNNGNNTVYGQPDFVVQILQVGILDQFNRFVSTTNIPSNSRVAVQFKVINQGNNSSMTNGWFFRAEMTDYPNINKVYNSDIQAGLIGGQSVTYTLGFDNLRFGSNSITVYADSQNNIYETNENNNLGTINFNVY